MKNLINILILVSISVSACTTRTPLEAAHSDLHRDLDPQVQDNDMSPLVEGNNTFAFDLYRSLRSEAANEVLSPYSISLALAMTFAGARTGTESQMADTLHFTLPQERLHPAFNKLDLMLTNESKPQPNSGQPLQLNIANALWGDRTSTFLQPYLDLLASNYGAGLQLVDFVNQSTEVRNEINRWVSDQTKQKIKDLIPEGALDSMTRLVLVNAIYFKADWQDQFDPADTADGPFHLLDGSVAQVKMMSHDFAGVPYILGDGYKAVELSYLGNTAAMDILVPDEGKFDEFEASLDEQKYNDILMNMEPSQLTLGLPKFNFRSSSDLGTSLPALGMPNAFDPGLADFSGMTGGRDLFISKVLHQAFVAVDEKGTEAAAATSVIMSLTSIMAPGEILTIDRPFIFIIRDISSKQILFIGRVLDPTK